MQFLYREHFASATSLLPCPVLLPFGQSCLAGGAHSQSDQRLLVLNASLVSSRLVSCRRPGTLSPTPMGGYVSPTRGVSIAWTGCGLRVAGCVPVPPMFLHCCPGAVFEWPMVAHGGRAPDAVGRPNSLPERQGRSAIGGASCSLPFRRSR